MLGFVSDFPISVFLDSERCAHGLGSRSAADQLCQASARITTLTTSAHVIVAVVAMSVRSVGGEEIPSFQSCGNGASGGHPSGCSGSWRFDERNSEGKEGELR